MPNPGVRRQDAVRVFSKYAAFLRGINVGGRHPVKMDDLRAAFEALGCQKVKTILASGNVVFETSSREPIAFVNEIEAKLESIFGHRIGVILRRFEDLQKLAKSNPFGKIKIIPQTRLYVTFLSATRANESALPFRWPEEDFAIVSATDTEICLALTLSPKTRTTDFMRLLEKRFGRNITTRNWNTITKILMAEPAGKTKA